MRGPEEFPVAWVYPRPGVGLSQHEGKADGKAQHEVVSLFLPSQGPSVRIRESLFLYFFI